MIRADGVTTDDQYGMEAVIDLYGCDLKKISDGEHIRKYLIKLCNQVILMRRYGKPIVEHFGHDNPITAGFSMVQLIETSCVSGHFSEHKQSAYINIFSCKWFDVAKAAEFTKEWFAAEEVKQNITDRI